MRNTTQVYITHSDSGYDLLSLRVIDNDGKLKAIKNRLSLGEKITVKLPPVEIDGVFAYELAHLRNNYVLVEHTSNRIERKESER